MTGKPQVTAKIGADATGIKKSLGGVKKQFAGLAKDIGRHMKTAAVVGMGGVAAGIGAALKNGLDIKVMQEQSAVLMKSLMGGADKARQSMAMLAMEAKANPMFSKQETLQAGANLAMFADGSVKKLKGLVDTAQLLSLLNPMQGLEGAAFALKEAEGGDYVSLAERFNISKTQIRNLKEAGLAGKELVDQILRANGISNKTLGDMMGTTGGQMASLRNTWDEISVDLFQEVWPKFHEVAKEVMGNIVANKDEIVKSIGGLFDIVKLGVDFMMGAQGTVDKASTWLADKMYPEKTPGLDAAIARNQMGDRTREVLKKNGLPTNGTADPRMVAKLRVDVQGMSGVPKMMANT